ncbi:MAG: hypothetical protein HYY06_03015 [Deltaproteobacteria bacterium]|nr:hypothetical protein [Deltaproteobacteria bacterium]
MPNHHSIVVAFGSLGARVLERVGQKGDLDLGPLPDEDPGRQLLRVMDEACARMALGSVIQASDPADPGEPVLDVVVVADLGEPGIAERLARFIAALRARLLADFSHLFGAHNPRFALCAVLALTGARDPGRRGALRAGLEGLEAISARAGEYEPFGRVFLIEDQSGRYLLPPAERENAVASLVTVLRSDAGRRTAGLGAPPDPQGLFVAFAAATLEVPSADLQRFCESRTARGLLEELRRGSDLGIADRQARIQPYLFDRGALDQRLGLKDGAGDLERMVRDARPRTECPELEPHATPEAIRDSLYGWDWYARQESEIRRFSEELEHFRMPALVAEVDSQGTKLARELPAALAKAVDGWVWSGPRGWADARDCLEDLRLRTEKAEGELASEIRREVLPDFPSFESFEERFRALRAGSERRPRPARLWFFGALFTLAATAILHPLPKWIWVRLLSGRAPLLTRMLVDPMAVELGPVGHAFLDRPWVLAWLALVTGSLVAWRLRNLARDRHAELGAMRDEMGYRLRDLVEGDRGSVLAYYLSRLRFSYRLWEMRILRRYLDAIRGEIERLETVRLALDQMDLAYREEERRLSPEPAGVSVRAAGPAPTRAQDANVLYRTVAGGPLFEAIHRADAQPADALAGAFFAELADPEPPPWRDAAPFADPLRIDAFVRSLLGPRERRALRPSSPQPVRDALSSFLADVGEKLAPGLEVYREQITLEPRRLLLVPSGAEPVVDECIAAVRRTGADAFGSGLLVSGCSLPSECVHLVVLEPGIPLRAIRAPAADAV